jgi:maleylacetate reductase
VNGNFVWRDAGRTVVFHAGGVAMAPKLLAEHGMQSFELLSSQRHLDGARALAEAASAVHVLPPMEPAVAVTEAAAALLETATGPGLVALGGGRTIDTAKAIAAITGGRVAAVPTTMSGAEMTGIHRLPAGAEDRAKGMVRPELVIADPAAMTRRICAPAQ